MSKKQLVIILIVLVIAAVVIILLMRSFLAPELPSAGEQNPPTSSLVPKSGTPDIEVLTGVLNLGEHDVTLTTSEGYLGLDIPGTDSLKILQNKGYQNGDKVNVMGKLREERIEVVGINKLIY